MIHPDVKEECREEIEKFFDSEKTLADYINLRTHGKDRFSVMTIKELETLIGEEVSSWIKNKLSIGDYANAMRWCSRGLNKEDSCKKAEIDAIRSVQKISYNMRKKRHAK